MTEQRLDFQTDWRLSWKLWTMNSKRYDSTANCE